MQTIEQQKDKRNSGSFIKNPANNENNNVSNGRQRTNGMAEAEAEVIINELQDGKIVDNERIITLLDIFLNDKKISPMTIASLKNEYINILQDIYMKNDSGLNKDISFSDKLIYMGIDRRMYSIVLKQINNFRRFINDKFKTIENGDMINDEDMKMLFTAILPDGLKLYNDYKLTLARQEGTGYFLEKLMDLGVSSHVSLLLMKQRTLWDNFIKEKLEKLNNYQMLDDEDMQTLFTAILPDGLKLYNDYKQTLAKHKGTGTLIRNLYQENKISATIYSLLTKQASLTNYFLNNNLEILNNGDMIPYEDMQTLFTAIFPDGLKLYNDYKQTLAKQNDTGDFFEKLMLLGVGSHVISLLMKQRTLRDKFIKEKLEYLYKGNTIDNGDIKLLFTIITSSKMKIDLYEKYQEILNEKDTQQVVDFINGLRTQVSNNKIFSILLLQFCNSGIKLPAEVRPSVLGNLVVPENAKFVKRAENKENFLGELHPVGKDEKTTLHGVLHNYFDEFVIKPITDANNILSKYIKKGFKIKDFPGIDGFSIRNAFKEAFKEEISKETIENLKKWLDEKVNDGTVKSLNDILKNDIKDLADIAEKLNNQTKMMTPDEFEDKNNIIDKTLEEIKDKIKQIRSKLSPNEDLINFMKCVVLSDTIKNGIFSRDLIAFSPEDHGAENSYRTPFYSLIMEDHNGKELTPEERVEYKKDMLFNSLTKATNPLFSHKPCAADINQDGLGDCYFLAALISLVNSPQYGPNFIMNMMKDNMDGTVTVRLYRASSDPAALEIDKKGNITSLHEIFVKVYKHGITYSPDCALWVNILEQAYAVIGGNLLKYKVDDKEKNDYNCYRNRKRRIADISAGRSNFSFMTLTGQVAYLYNKKINDIENNRDIYAYTNKYGGLFKFISNALNKGFPVTIAFDDDFNTKEGKQIFSNHAYSVSKINGNNVELIDTYHGGETICCPIEEIEDHTKYIYVCGEDL